MHVHRSSYICSVYRLLNFPVVSHHVVEVDVLVYDGTVTPIIVEKLLLGDAFALLVAVHCITVRSVVSEVVDERLQHLPLRPLAVQELRMFHMIVRRLHYVAVTNNTASNPARQ